MIVCQLSLADVVASGLSRPGTISVMKLMSGVSTRLYWMVWDIWLRLLLLGGSPCGVRHVEVFVGVLGVHVQGSCGVQRVVLERVLPLHVLAGHRAEDVGEHSTRSQDICQLVVARVEHGDAKLGVVQLVGVESG